MARELVPIDVSNTPDLLRLAQEVQASGCPRVLRQGGENLAVLVPVPMSKPRPIARSTHDAAAIVERTAGVFRRYAKQPPLTAEEERAAIEQVIAEDVAEQEGG